VGSARLERLLRPCCDNDRRILEFCCVPILENPPAEVIMNDDYGDIIKRMMHDLQEDDDSPNQGPRCEGCGERVALAPYQLRASNGSAEWVMYCATCRALAALADTEDYAS
jgi:hypothetical protein